MKFKNTCMIILFSQNNLACEETRGRKSNLKCFSLIMLFLFFSILCSIPNKVEAARRLEGIENFPKSYEPYLLEIQKDHPNWKFTALYTDLDWNYVINNQNTFGKNLVPKSYIDTWKNTKPGEYNVEVDSGWVDASRKAVEYCMDPRNFLNVSRIFQFEELSYDQKSNNVDGIEKILYGTEFYNRTVEYKDHTGKNIVTNKKYADLVLSAGTTSLVSPYHLASRIKQEVGPFLSHNSISGTVSGYEGYYNFYNIGATSDPDYMQVIKNGLRYAKDGKGASVSTKDKYQIPWNTKERAITGGSIFIGSSYINIGQDTIYFQKFDVNNEKPGELFWHQYMTNVLAPYSESKLIYTGYQNSGLLNFPMSFIIPVYNNMLQIPVDNPNILDKDYTDDNTKVFANVQTTLNIRTGPGTSYEALTTVNKNDIMTRIKKGKQSGDLWDKVVLENGMVGYVFQSYLVEVPNVKIENIEVSIPKTKIDKNETVKLNVEIFPEEAKQNKIIFTSSNNTVALVDNTGNILGVGSGTCEITVRNESGSISKSVTIEIYSKVEEINIVSSDLILIAGSKFELNAIIFPEDASNKTVFWKSDDTNIATVDGAGVITGVQERKN